MVNKTINKISELLAEQAQVLAAPLVTADHTREYYRIIDSQRAAALAKNDKDWEDLQLELANA